MLAYGYPVGSESDIAELLQETSLVCTREELDRLILYLQKIRDDCNDYEEVAGIHRHYRDFDKSWDTANSDFIVCLTDKECTRNIE